MISNGDEKVEIQWNNLDDELNDYDRIFCDVLYRSLFSKRRLEDELKSDVFEVSPEQEPLALEV